MRFWKVYLGVQIGMAVITIVWFSAGGFLDLREMLRRLKTQVRDHTDDGFVDERNTGDSIGYEPNAGGRSGADGMERGKAEGQDRG
jgi:hypothetical protein